MKTWFLAEKSSLTAEENPTCSSMEQEFWGLRNTFQCHVLSMQLPGDMYSPCSDRRLGHKQKQGRLCFDRASCGVCHVLTVSIHSAFHPFCATVVAEPGSIRAPYRDYHGSNAGPSWRSLESSFSVWRRIYENGIDQTQLFLSISIARME